MFSESVLPASIIHYIAIHVKHGVCSFVLLVFAKRNMTYCWKLAYVFVCIYRNTSLSACNKLHN